MSLPERVPEATLSATARRILAIDAEIASLDHTTGKERLATASVWLLVFLALIAGTVLALHWIAPERTDYALTIFLAIAFGASTERAQRFLSRKGRRRLKLEREWKALTHGERVADLHAEREIEAERRRESIS